MSSPADNCSGLEEEFPMDLRFVGISVRSLSDLDFAFGSVNPTENLEALAGGGFWVVVKVRTSL